MMDPDRSQAEREAGYRMTAEGYNRPAPRRDDDPPDEGLMPDDVLGDDVICHVCLQMVTECTCTDGPQIAASEEGAAEDEEECETCGNPESDCICEDDDFVVCEICGYIEGECECTEEEKAAHENNS